MMNTAPIIDLAALPKDEWEPARFVQQSLDGFEARVVEFKHSLSLAIYASTRELAILNEFTELSRKIGASSFFAENAELRRFDLRDNTDRRKEFSNWLRMAVRHGAIVAYEFWMAMQSLNDHLGACPVLRSKIDNEEKKKAQREFIATFPSVGPVRTSAAHGSELGSSTADIDKHAYRGEKRLDNGEYSMNLFISGSMSVNGETFTYESSIKNKLVSYELSEGSLLSLSVCTNHFWNTFLPVENETSRWQRANLD